MSPTTGIGEYLALSPREFQMLGNGWAHAAATKFKESKNDVASVILHRLTVPRRRPMELQ